MTSRQASSVMVMTLALSVSTPSPPVSSRSRPQFLAFSQSTSSNHRPALILPGLGNNTGDYEKLQLTLQKYGVPTVVAKVSRVDWLRNAAGLIDPNYWRGTLRPRPVLDWYFKRIDDAIHEANEIASGRSLSIIGHSAGGWLARVYMEEFGPSNISLLLTLGTPHQPPPKGVQGVIDQTRGLLDYVEKNCARAVYTPELKYVCIAGRYIQGARFLGNSILSVDSTINIENNQSVAEVAVVGDASMSTFNAPTFRARFIGQGYKQVCGQADVWGDGVVPEVSAHLEGALNISFDGVYHSPVGSDDELRPWYGSPAIVEQWIEHLIN
ncbi:GPI inositol-deacylase PGAP1-like [Dillenia turbinata]|uniref:GPI inositol-deacylase n=1 Tax=Dillenia turbinata TaxID=194707 RepID=A0AAN8V2L2_9MAGN